MDESPFFNWSIVLKKIKFNRSVMVPKIGVFNVGQEKSFDDEYAAHVVENMKAADYVDVKNSPPTIDDIVAAIALIATDDETAWTADGTPKVEVLEGLLNKNITAAQRDTAYLAFRGVNK